MSTDPKQTTKKIKRPIKDAQAKIDAQTEQLQKAGQVTTQELDSHLRQAREALLQALALSNTIRSTLVGKLPNSLQKDDYTQGADIDVAEHEQALEDSARRGISKGK